uniref:Uncharacterized protein n=1 Tax=Arundo donax TaxID=35708 RepID=A0A0A9BUY6_ARUDO
MASRSSPTASWLPFGAAPGP